MVKLVFVQWGGLWNTRDSFFVIIFPLEFEIFGILKLSKFVCTLKLSSNLKIQPCNLFYGTFFLFPLRNRANAVSLVYILNSLAGT